MHIHAQSEVKQSAAYPREVKPRSVTSNSDFEQFRVHSNSEAYWNSNSDITEAQKHCSSSHFVNTMAQKRHPSSDCERPHGS